MCNRCDGGNKRLIKFQCEDPLCQFVYYQTEDEDITDEICVKCKKGKGIPVIEGEV